MKLINKGDAFKVQFNFFEYTIPSGEFETNNPGLVTHIQNKAIYWNKDVQAIAEEKIVEGEGAIVVPVKKEEVKVEEAKEECVECKMTEEVKKPKGKK